MATLAGGGGAHAQSHPPIGGGEIPPVLAKFSEDGIGT